MTAKILIIDDDKFTREVLRKILERDPLIARLKPEIFMAANGLVGVEEFERERPSLVIVDLFMPKMDGFAVCKRLRELASANELTIAVTSGVYKDAAIAKQIEQDFSAHFFAKPYQVKNLAAFAASALMPHAADLPPARSQQATQDQQRSGDLGKRNAAAIFWDLLEEEATGRLLLRRGQVVRQIELFVGHPVSVTTNVREETLGHFLVTRNVIDVRAHREAMATAASQKKRLGETLIAMGLLSPRQLIQELTAQTRLKLVHALRWRDGAWSFRPTASGTSRGNALDFAEVIVKGLASTAQVDTPAPELQAMQEQALMLTERGQSMLEQIGRSVSQAFVKHFEQGIRWSDLGRRGVSPKELYACLDVLHACGGLQAPAPVVVLPKPAAAHGEPTPMRTPPDSPARPAGTNELYSALFDDDPAPPAAGMTPLASLESTEPWAAPAQEALDLDEPEPSAQEPLDLGLPEPPGEAAVSVSFEAIPQHKHAPSAQQDLIREFLRIQEKNLYEVLELAADANLETINAAYHAHAKSFAKERFDSEDLGRDYQKLDVLLDAYEQARQTLGDPAERQRYDDGLFSATGAMEGAPSIDAELVFREAEELLLDGDFEQAIVKLRASVEIAPYEAAYRATLGWALFAGGQETAAAADLARPHLNEAMILSPDSGLVHEYLGRIHAVCGDDADAAVLHLRKALDDDPRRGAALLALETLHLGRGEFRELEAVYRRILFRLAGREDDEAALLWSRLGDLHSHYMHDDAAALLAYQRARKLAPENQALHDRCLQLSSGGLGPLYATADVLLRTWQDEPTDFAPLHSLLAQAETAQLHDICFLAASALVASGQHEPSADRWYQRYRPRFAIRAQKVFDADIWSELLHPEDDPKLGALFALLAPVIQELAAPAGAAEELAATTPVDESALPPEFRAVRAYLAHELGVVAPDIRSHPDYGSMLSVVASTPPTILAGYDVLTSTDKLELCFRLGRAMSYLRPGRAIAAGSPPRTLKSAMLACYALGSPDASIADPDGQLRAFKTALTALDSNRRAQLQELVTRISRDHPTLNLSRWSQKLARTADRVGMVLCGDIPLSKRIACELSDAATGTELLAFAASPQHMQIRRALGLGIDV